MKLTIATIALSVLVASNASAGILGAFTAREIAEGATGHIVTGFKSSRSNPKFVSARDLSENGGALRKYTFSGDPSRIVGYTETSNR